MTPSSRRRSGSAIETSDRISKEAWARLGRLSSGTPEIGEQFTHPLDELVGLDVATLEEGRIGRVEPHPGPRRLADPARQSVVVGVDVGDHDRLHVVDGATGYGEAVVEGPPRLVGVPSGVDEGHAVVELEDVDEHVAQRVVRDRDGHRPQTRSDPLDGGSTSRSHASFWRVPVTVITAARYCGPLARARRCNRAETGSPWSGHAWLQTSGGAASFLPGHGNLGTPALLFPRRAVRVSPARYGRAEWWSVPTVRTQRWGRPERVS